MEHLSHLLLTKGAFFEGHLSFEGIARISGSFKGSIEGSGILVVEPEGRIEAHVIVRELVLKGWMKGEVKAHKTVSLIKGSEFYGKIGTLNLHIETGALFEGTSLNLLNKAEHKKS